jgi:XTP/dITP diphosphohydrolase
VTSTSSDSKQRLVVATLNRGKGRELARLLADLPFEIVLLSDVPGARLPEETGLTYADNAEIKARAAADATGLLALGDDSGLEVDALDGAPGLYSARFGGPGLDDAGRSALLLDRLRDTPDVQRTARFRCVLALVSPWGRVRFAEGVVEGVIARAPRGTGGFGYDPVFYYPPRGCTLAELPEGEKLQVDHRGAAVRALREVLKGR